MSCENGFDFRLACDWWTILCYRKMTYDRKTLHSILHTQFTYCERFVLVCSDSHKMHRLISSFHNRKTHSHTRKAALCLTLFVSRFVSVRRQQKSFTRVAAQSKNRHESTEIMNEKHTEMRRWNAEATGEALPTKDENSMLVRTHGRDARVRSKQKPKNWKYLKRNYEMNTARSVEQQQQLAQ